MDLPGILYIITEKKRLYAWFILTKQNGMNFINLDYASLLIDRAKSRHILITNISVSFTYRL
jgi:hypothetical protein